MPLSEHEQHLLEQMEQAMYAEDPRFASSMQGSLSRARLRRRIAIGAVAVLGGLGLIVLGVIHMSSAVWLGGAGFVLMIAGVAYALTPTKVAKPPLAAVRPDGTVQRPQAAPLRGGRAKGPRQRKASPGGGTFMSRLEQRWDKRRGGFQ